MIRRELPAKTTRNPERLAGFVLALAVLLLAVAVAPATAADGIHEINQACVAEGCFPGDDPGFPVTIPARGSYQLTSNLDLRNEVDPEDVTAIEVSITGPENAGAVTIDLNGFGIFGETSCLGTPPTQCTPLGTGVGIFSLGNRITVRNGFIQGMGSHCINLVSDAQVEKVRVSSCGGNGIELGPNSRVRDNSVWQTWGHGIVMNGGPSQVTDNIVVGTHQDGLLAPARVAYGGNSFDSNDGDAISGLGVQISTNICGGVPCP